jgi:ribose transport system substrate-binding protein
MPNTKGEWYTPELYGITDEAKKLGYDVIIQDAGGYANVDKQVTQVSNLIVQRVRAILLDSADPAAFNGVVGEAKEAKFRSLRPAAGRWRVISPGCRRDLRLHRTIGHGLAAGAEVAAHGGSIAILAGPPRHSRATDCLGCFREDIAGSTIKMCRADERAGCGRRTRSRVISPALRARLLLCRCGRHHGVGIARAVQAVGKCGKARSYSRCSARRRRK